MDPFAQAAMDLVVRYGPWILFVMAVAETSFPTGLVVPSGVATSVGTILGLEGLASLPAMWAAALAGGLVGDTLGFWIGRGAGRWLADGDGWAARRFRRHRPAADRFLDRHPVYAVTVARWVSFVRTLMPNAAGMGRIPYPTFLLYDIPGVLGWMAIYVGIGVLARESWQVVAPLVGAGWLAVFAVAGLVLWVRGRRARRRPSC